MPENRGADAPADHRPMRDIEARHVKEGDLLSWCGRWVVVEDVEITKPRGSGTQKPGRRFLIAIEGHDARRVHYFYDEWVMVR